MNPEMWALAERVLTQKQFDILVLRERHGMSIYQIAYARNLSVSSVRSHLRAVDHNLGRALSQPVEGGSPSGTERRPTTIRRTQEST